MEGIEAIGLVRVVASDYQQLARKMIQEIRDLRTAEGEKSVEYWTERITRRHWWQFWRSKSPTKEQAHAAMSANWICPSSHEWSYHNQLERCEKVLRLCQASSDGYIWISPEFIASVRGPSFGTVTA